MLFCVQMQELYFSWLVLFRQLKYGFYYIYNKVVCVVLLCILLGQMGYDSKDLVKGIFNGWEKEVISILVFIFVVQEKEVNIWR